MAPVGASTGGTDAPAVLPAGTTGTTRFNVGNGSADGLRDRSVADREHDG